MEIPFSYKVLQTFFDEALPDVDELADLIIRHSFEVTEITKGEGDTKITIDILPNRAHDVSSYYFFAKEISVISGKKLKPIPSCAVQDGDIDAPNIGIKNKELCNRYCARKVENIAVSESPDWLKDTLIKMGQKPINNIVDATNFVMWSYNQPTHAFDADKILGGINVRNAEKGEQLTTLDGKEILFDGSELVIADDDGPIAIAGVKGGNKAEVDNNTKNIILESANFNPVSIRKTSRALGIITDSSRRFEHDISSELAKTALVLLTHMIINIAGTDTTKVSEVADEYPNKYSIKNIQVSLETVNNVLGVSLSKEKISDILDKLMFEYSEKEGVFSVIPPVERVDLQNIEDMVEEIGRVYGYNNIKPNPISEMDFEPRVSHKYYYQVKIENILQNIGFSQIETYSMQEDGDIAIANPYAQDKGYLRKDMVKGFQDALLLNTYNMDLLGLFQIRQFEIGAIFKKGEEETHLTLGIKNGKLFKGKKDEEIYLKEVLESLENELGVSISIDDGVIEKGGFGIIFEISFDKMIDGLSEKDSYDVLDNFKSSKAIYKTPSQYPFIVRDIAVWVPSDTKKEELIKVIKDKAGELLVRETLFDEFEKPASTQGGDGRISYAYRLVFQSYEKTLTDDEVGIIIEGIEKEISNKGWEVR